MGMIYRSVGTLTLLLAAGLIVSRVETTRAQQGGNPPAGNLPGANQAAGNQRGAVNGFVGGAIPGGILGGNNGAPGNPGGAASADFDSLIDLITSTVENE